MLQDHEEEKRAGSAKQANEVKGEPRYEAIHASPPVSPVLFCSSAMSLFTHCYRVRQCCFCFFLSCPQHKRPPYSDDMEATRSHNIVSVKFKNG